MTTIKVPDMMCENCVKRITNALTAAELKFQVDLAEKKVTIDGCENCVKPPSASWRIWALPRRFRAENWSYREEIPRHPYGSRGISVCLR